MRPAIIHIIYIIPIRASHLQLLNLRFELTDPMLVGFCFARSWLSVGFVSM